MFIIDVVYNSEMIMNFAYEVQRCQNTKEIYTNSFRWERGKGEILNALFIMEDFEVLKQVKNRMQIYN